MENGLTSAPMVRPPLFKTVVLMPDSCYGEVCINAGRQRCRHKPDDCKNSSWCLSKSCAGVIRAGLKSPDQSRAQISFPRWKRFRLRSKTQTRGVIYQHEPKETMRINKPKLNDYVKEVNQTHVHRHNPHCSTLSLQQTPLW